MLDPVTGAEVLAGADLSGPSGPEQPLINRKEENGGETRDTDAEQYKAG